MTSKLYDIDSYISEFEATVLSCTKRDDGKFEIELDKTAFFPTSGGQGGDDGYIGECKIEETIYKDKEETTIIHISDSCIEPGKTVKCKINFDVRYRKMQNHTGEHIISGLVHRKFGFENVGFHLSHGCFTCDYNGYISDEDLELLEKETNRIIYAQKNIYCYYPSKEELDALEYRSKKELNGDVRIVEIQDTDKCACCAPHVKNTGEVGIFKITEHMKYKGGVRLTCKCGYDALEDYSWRIKTEKEISIMLSSPVNEILNALNDTREQINQLKKRISDLKHQTSDIYVSALSEDEKNVCIFIPDYDMNDLRNLCNDVCEKTKGTCTCFSNGANDTYIFVIVSKDKQASIYREKICSDLNGKCGGRDNMLTGTLGASIDEIKSYFEKEKYLC